MRDLGLGRGWIKEEGLRSTVDPGSGSDEGLNEGRRTGEGGG